MSPRASRSLRSWAWVAVPALAGGVVSLALDRAWSNQPELYLRADVSGLTWVAGLILSAGLTVVAMLQARSHRELAAARRQTLARSSEEHRRFIQRLDHELKNPLTAIHAALVNTMGTAPAETRHAAIESVRAQALRIGSLVTDLRKLSDLETRSLEATSVDLTELLDEVVAAARDHPNAAARDLQLSVPRAPWPLPSVYGDWDLLVLAFYNLLNNALKFTRPGDTIEVRAFEDGRDVVIEVADTGPGIPDEELSLVWEELYRGRSTRETPGSGLGLALVRAIVARHGGSASLRSRSGQGTVVSVSLPVERSSDRAAAGA